MIKYLIPYKPKILFVGINPHYGSYAKGVPFSNNKTFWYNLAKSGLIREPISVLRSDEGLKTFYYTKFEKYGFGFVNLINRPSRDVSQLERGEEAEGIKRLYRVLAQKRPRIVCFVGKVTYEKFAGNKKFRFGFQKETLFGAKVFVARFPIRGSSSIRINELRRLKLSSVR
ncbi:MAG: mismatch-specific DNA-glycosylase [Candidatus Micrarchaeia archaeon]